jgi:glycosyltransferase involved in cell wall biosynthesis
VKIFIVSLKLNPGHLAQVSGIYRTISSHHDATAILSNGFEIYNIIGRDVVALKYGFSDSYFNIIKSTICFIATASSSKSMFNHFKVVDLVVFQCPHPINIVIMRKLRKENPRVKFASWIHEYGEMSFSNYSPGQVFNLLLNKFLISLLRPLSDFIILSSPKTRNDYLIKHPKDEKKLVQVPLIFNDRSLGATEERCHFSFIGVATKNKGIDIFFRIVTQAVINGCGYKFLIVTKSDINRYLDGLPAGSEGFLDVVNSGNITDSEIDRAIRSSLAVLYPARMVTQSGVVPVAFMHGTPVIGSNVIGLRDQIIDGVSGLLVENFEDPYEWLRKMDDCTVRFDELSVSARRNFCEHYSSATMPNGLNRIISETRHASVTSH